MLLGDSVSEIKSTCVQTVGFLQVKCKSGYVVFSVFDIVVVASYSTQYCYLCLCYALPR